MITLSSKTFLLRISLWLKKLLSEALPEYSITAKKPSSIVEILISEFVGIGAFSFVIFDGC